MVRGATAVGRPKSVGKKDRLPIIGIRATPEWAKWLKDLAEAKRTDVAGIVDRVLAEWAEANGYPPPPKRRP